MQLLICCQGQWAGDRGGAALHIGMVIHQSVRWHARQKKGEPHSADRGHQFHETFPPLHLKARHNHVQGRCTMKWNGRPDPGERTQCRVHRNEGHSLPRDASVSRKGPAGPGQTVPLAASWSTAVKEMALMCASLDATRYSKKCKWWEDFWQWIYC